MGVRGLTKQVVGLFAVFSLLVAATSADWLALKRVNVDGANVIHSALNGHLLANVVLARGEAAKRGAARNAARAVAHRVCRALATAREAAGVTGPSHIPELVFFVDDAAEVRGNVMVPGERGPKAAETSARARRRERQLKQACFSLGVDPGQLGEDAVGRRARRRVGRACRSFFVITTEFFVLFESCFATELNAVAAGYGLSFGSVQVLMSTGETDDHMGDTATNQARCRACGRGMAHPAAAAAHSGG
jgi:hypothetical protein